MPRQKGKVALWQQNIARRRGERPKRKDAMFKTAFAKPDYELWNDYLPEAGFAEGEVRRFLEYVGFK